MLDLKFIRENAELVKKGLLLKKSLFDLDLFLEKDSRHREILKVIEEKRSVLNSTSKEIAQKKGTPEAEELKSGMKLISDEISAMNSSLSSLSSEISGLLLSIPNLPHPEVPEGVGEKDNRTIREYGTFPKFDFTPRDHQDIGEALDIIDFKRAAKLSGARFALFKGAGARLERALISFMLDIQTKKNGYNEILPPALVTEKNLVGTGQLPKFGEELYKCAEEDLYLIPTAEVPLTNLFRDEILEDSFLPAKFTAWTPCFRRESGSYGKDTRGLIRNHQFDKVELLKFVRPEESFAQLESLTRDAESILLELGLPYRVILLCSGDMSFASAKTYDLEVWMPSENRYREISSCSNFQDFQARRINIRYKNKEKKLQFVHTINGSGLACGRTFAAILENCQQKDGTVRIPEKLVPYFGSERIK